MGSVNKRLRQTDLSGLTEPVLSPTDKVDFQSGIELFNRQKFWEAHEAWEAVWIRHTEKNRVFFQGLIQVAAACHQLRRKISHGFEKHTRNALWKLQPFRPNCLGINIEELVVSLLVLLEKLEQDESEFFKQKNLKLPSIKVECNQP